VDDLLALQWQFENEQSGAKEKTKGANINISPAW